MLRKCTDEDISNEECKNVIDPFYDNFDEDVVTYIMPEVIAFYIASSFYRNAMWEATFLQHFNSAADSAAGCCSAAEYCYYCCCLKV